jgi:hypothetical protein
MLVVLGALAAFAAPAPAAASQFSQPDGGFAYVFLPEGGRSSSMSGSTEDLKRAKAARRGNEGLLYFRDGGAAYAIRDAATMRRAEALFEPQMRVGARQAELGSRQAALGSRQAALGAQQARIGAQQANATPRRAMELGRQQAALGEQQGALGVQQDALGKQQAALGGEQARLAREADAKFRELLAEARRRGLAQRIN